LGLQVPEFAQSEVPHNAAYEAPGLDLTNEQCDALVAFVSSLPAPIIQPIGDPTQREYLQRGRRRFDSVGCAVCHTPNLGPVAHIYSDLLLHDMGPRLSDSGSYGGFVPNSTEEDDTTQPIPELVRARAGKVTEVDASKLIGATRQEWRTPPLWGVRDSAPYLHDGRAATLEQAIALHGGEGASSARKFFHLSETERLEVLMFLRALVAPQN
jgi:CxxC motif-containing protein (DUF1111 family)